MGGLSPIHWLIILAVLLVVFARPGKLSGFMGDAAKGIRAFREGLKGDEDKTAGQAESAKPLPAPTPDKDPIVR
jgi:sec-independent protein translocase protein TatA